MKVGSNYNSNAYGKFRVLSVINSREAVIVFLNTGYITSATPNNIEQGRVKDKHHPNVHGVGFIGKGNHKANSIAYRKWSGMISRCYNEKNKSFKSYKDCSVDVDWFNFQNFAEWFFLQGAPDDYELDKDTLIIGNRIYSADTCVLMPKAENIKAKIPQDSNNKHGYAGVYMTTYKDTKYYNGKLTIDGKRVNVSGGFRSAKDAYEALQLRKSQLNK